MPPKTTCGNPLYLQWIEELRDQAREKGSKAYESYSKAARSLANCPVTYNRPRDLVVLVGIGPKTISILESKWKKYCADNGLPEPSEPAPVKKKAKTKSKSTFDFGSDEGTDSEADEPPPPVKKRKATKPKQYIPAKGSGGYGILLGLVLAIENPQVTTQVFLTKSEVIRKAQPYSDSSYEHSEKGSHFTAWSNMKTLIGKGYVYTTGNPHKFCLTEEGYDVACVIRSLLPEFAHIAKQPFHYDNTPAPIRTVLPTPPPRDLAESSAMASRRVSGGKFQFWYIDSLGKRVDEIFSAMIRLDPIDFVTLRKIELLASQRDHAFVSQLRLLDPTPLSRDGYSTLFAFIDEETAPPKCSRFETQSRPLSHIPTPVSDDDDWVALPNGSTSGIQRTDTVMDLDPTSLVQKIGRSVAPTPTYTEIPHRPAPRLSSHVTPLHPLEKSATDITNLPDFDPSKALVFPAGSYEIVLILDTREIESKSNRDRFADKLAEKGVKLETRALRLGDVIWIARKLDGVGGEEDECVLDYVLERKRLDDLVSSMRDGRYHEQCFRLSNSGISNVYYLVEDFQTSHHMEFSGLQIMTAKSQIQVHNRFILQETKKLSDSIDFLTTMTKVIKNRLRHTDLHIIPTQYLSRSSYLPLRRHLAEMNSTTYHTSFQAYQDMNDKSASSTLRDKFARMLLCVKGMSAEKTSAILDVYDTPRQLFEALEQAVNEAPKAQPDDAGGKGKKKASVRGPELFFSDRIPGEGRRKIGDALSRELFRIFWGALAE